MVDTKSQARAGTLRNGRGLGWGMGVLLALGALFCQPRLTQAQSQNPFSEFASYTYEKDPDFVPSMALGDLDGDGDLDLAVAGGDDPNQKPNPNRVYRNDGNAQLTVMTLPGADNDTRSVGWGDMDGDGDLDLAAGNKNAANQLYRNDGNSLFTPFDLPGGANPTRAIAWGDMDQDGKLDLAVGNEGVPNFILHNEGGGAFTVLNPTATAKTTTSLAWGDAEGDGDLDLAVGNEGSINEIYLNNGDRTFSVSDLPGTAGFTQQIAWGDIDGDGDLDLTADALRFYRNDGNTTFTLFFVFRPAEYTLNILNFMDWGDIDGDGDLDLVLLGSTKTGMTGSNLAYLNQGDTNQDNQVDFVLIKLSGVGTYSQSGAVGDLDGDGDLDLAVTEYSVKLYPNVTNPRFQLWQANVSAAKHKQIALGDMDNDGDLDLAVGNDEAVTQVYVNNGLGSFAPPIDLPGGAKTPNTVAWGDMDNDGDLDLVAGANGATNHLYRNDGNGNFVLLPLAGLNGYTYALAWGDMDGDGDLDLAVGGNSPNVLYRNDGNSTFTKLNLELPADGFTTSSLAWGDLDSDGDLDLAVGNSISSSASQAPNQLYRNQGNGTFTLSYLESVADARNTSSVAWGDMDGDGDLDLAAGNWNSFSQVYQNEDSGFIARSLGAVATTEAIAWGDVDGDGDLDLAAANLGSNINRVNNFLYRNDGDGQFSLGVLQPLIHSHSLAWGDMDGDGDLDLVTSDDPLDYGQPDTFGKGLTIYFNPMPGSRLLPANAPAITVPYRLSPLIQTQQIIPLTYLLKDRESDPVGRVAAFYSPDGGGRWLPAVSAANPITTNLATSPGGVAHVFNWDTFASGFFGQSDNVVFRFIAYSQPAQAAPAGSYQYRAGVADSQQRPTASVMTLPLRVRGAQVRVFSNATGNPLPVRDALVYRLPAGQSRNARPLQNATNQTPYRTDALGYLQGRGQISQGDGLVALAPITATESYSLYYTSATPTLSGLTMYTVTNAGVQTLTVSANQPLLLFNLEVALEWDARKDKAFLDQLDFDLKRTAEFLFDATDGQAALGEITLYHNKEQWERADIRIYASNALIPNADPGGIVPSERSEVIASNSFISATTPYSITYQPGRIRIGAVWNRFGEATGTLGEDWPRTLAHELGHYAFYLYDNYLGLQNGVVVPVTSCTGTLMTDQYREDFSEFRTTATWATDCAQTISAQRSGRADWQTITRFYPWLKLPSGQANPGPVTLPLAVTQIESRFATTPTQPIDVAVFDLVAANGAAQLSGLHAQAVLYSAERLIDLGHPVVDKLEARGAHVGDRLCVYDLLEARLGCETITTNDNFLTLVQKTGWQPEIVVSPVTSRTISVLVSNVPAGLTLQGKLYPENGAATPPIGFALWSGGVYSTTFQLSAGVLAGHIQVWVDEAASAANPRRESLTSYALGGSPGKIKKPAKGNKRSLASTAQAGSEDVTPAIAPDGQVLIYGNVSFNDGEFYALQKVNRLPLPPLWTTVVGDGYRILKSANAPDLKNTSILFRYRGQDVPAGEENFLSLYFWDEPRQQWRKLSTVHNQAVNEASAQAPGPGLYVLMSSLEIPLTTAGWNLVAYPVQETRPVTAALASLAGRYKAIYGYQNADPDDPWAVYAPGVPTYVNDLEELVFGQGYWINASQVTTWLVKGPDTGAVAAAGGLALPPATYYGVVLPTPGFVPTPGLPVQALLDGAVCGAGVTQAVDGQIVYTLNVSGDGSRPSCFGAGKQVTFTVAGMPLGSIPWQNETVQMVNFGVGATVYLPEIHR